MKRKVEARKNTASRKPDNGSKNIASPFGASESFEQHILRDEVQLRLLRDVLLGVLPCTSRLQLETVEAIARCQLQLDQLQRFKRAKLKAEAANPEAPLYDEQSALETMVLVLPAKTDFKDIEVTIAGLHPRLQHQFEQHCPRRKFLKPEQWATAIRQHIEAVLLPQARQFGTPPSEYYDGQIAKSLTPEYLDWELGHQERLHALIDRHLNRYHSLKRHERKRTLSDFCHDDRDREDRIIKTLLMFAQSPVDK